VVITPSSLAAIFLSFNTLFQSGLKSVQPMAEPRLATRMPSATESNVYAFMAKLLRMREWLGDRMVQNVSSKSYTLPNKKYELTVEVERTKIADDQLGVYSPLLSEMGTQTGLLMDDLVIQALKDGDDSTLGLTYDGKAFFATDHPVDPDGQVSGTQSNKLTAADLDATTFEAARVAMAKFQGADGRVLGVRGTLLIVPPQLETKAKKIVKAEHLSTGESNPNLGMAEILVLPQLADEPTVWYLADVSRAIKPLISQVREAPNFVQLTAPDSAPVFSKDMYVFGSSARGAAGYGLWFLITRNAP
jgi:phage major head subunit gpT-like protein